jgi:hypothetical protein
MPCVAFESTTSVLKWEKAFNVSDGGATVIAKTRLLLLLLLYGPLLDLGPFPSSLVVYTSDMTPWPGDQPVSKSFPTHRATKVPNKRIQTSVL